MINDSFISLLIIKYITGALSDAEAVLLARWVSESSENELAYKEEIASLTSQVSSSSDAAEFWTIFKERNVKEFEGIKKRKALRRLGFVATASVAAAVIAAVFLFRTHDNPSIESGAPVAIVRHSEEKPVSDAVSSVRQVSSQTVYIAEHGEIFRTVLPDGTKIVLNSDSRLTLSRSFNRHTREVELDGEAFFDVAKDSTRLFIIRCGQESYIVRGTSFNINSYSSDGYSVATLHEGSLEARVKSDIIKLEPGEELRVDDNASSLTKHRVNVENSTNWINTTKIIFDDTPLRQVANRLARKYQVSINVQPEIGNIPYTGVNDDETVDEVLRLLEITAPVSLTVTRNNNEYYISKK